jgi:catechol 2,3-dioxygenase-like lactoylglutathione lyase family enzyme
MAIGVTLGVGDLTRSVRFYETVLAALGSAPVAATASDHARRRGLVLRPAGATGPTRRLHVGFAAPSRGHVDRFWQAGVRAGYRDDGGPGPRPEYGDDYYGGFLLDPDGNSAEAVHHGSVPAPGAIDHLWIRVADVAASKAFYRRIAAAAGLELRRDTPERARFADASASFSLVAGDAPTERLHMTLTAAGAGPEERLVDPDGNDVTLVVS